MPALLVVNLRSLINSRAPVRKTLEQLHIDKHFRATVIPDTPSFRGMLRLVKDYVAWCPAEAGLVSDMIRRRGRGPGRRAFTDETARTLSFEGIDGLAEGVAKGVVLLSKTEALKPWFCLMPPKGGFKKSIRRQHTQGGILGENPELSKLVDSML